MSDLGRRLRDTLDEVAPPADLDRIVAHEPSLPFWRVGRVLGYAAVLVAVVGITGFLLTRVGSDDTAVDSSVTTVEGTVTTVGDVPAVDDLVIPIVDPPSTDPLAGTWTKTNLGLDGLLVMPIDVIWDGEAFYLLQRVAFGDMRIWRSEQGLDWTELPSIGRFTIADGGPLAIARYRDGLVAGGHVGDEAAIWVLDANGWTETRLGTDAFVSDVVAIGDRIVAIGTTVVPGVVPERHAHLWVSSDGLVWQEQDPGAFGELSYAAGVVAFNSQFVAVANRSWLDSNGLEVRGEPLILSSTNGSVWEELAIPIGVETLRGVEGGGLLRLSALSSVYLSADAESWGHVLIDRTGLDPRFSVQTGWLQGRLLLLGGIEKPNERFGDVSHPYAWSYRGPGEWGEVGSGLEGFGPGVIDGGVEGNGAFVAVGRQATEGSPDDGWALYTFVMEPDTASEFGPAITLDVNLVPPDVNSVVIRNEGPVPIDISGWRLESPGFPSLAVTIPDGVIVEPGDSYGVHQIEVRRDTDCPGATGTAMYLCYSALAAETRALHPSGIVLETDGGVEVARWPLLDHVNPLLPPAWAGGGELKLGEPWLFDFFLSGCGWDHLGDYNGEEWFITSDEFEPGAYPTKWNVQTMHHLLGDFDYVESILMLVDPARIEVTTLDGDLVAVLEPIDREAPFCGDGQSG